MAFSNTSDPGYDFYAQQRDALDAQRRRKEEQERTLIAKESGQLVEAAFNGDSTTFGELLEQVIDEYRNAPERFIPDYKPSLIATLDNTINSRPRADKSSLKTILTLLLDKDRSSAADHRYFDNISLGKAITNAITQKKWWAVHTLLDINPHKCFIDMPTLGDLLTRVILEEHENQTDAQLEQTEQLDEATEEAASPGAGLEQLGAAAGAATSPSPGNPLQGETQEQLGAAASAAASPSPGLEQLGASRQEAATVEPQESREYLIQIRDLLLEHYHVNPFQMINIYNQHEEHEATQAESMSLMHYYFKIDSKKCDEFFVKCALSEHGLEHNIGFRLLSFNIETAFANTCPDLIFISRQLKPELTNLYGNAADLHRLIQMSLELALNHENISAAHKLDFITSILKVSKKNTKKEDHATTLRSTIEHALDHGDLKHGKKDLLITLLTNIKNESLCRDRIMIFDLLRITFRGIITSPIYYERADLLRQTMGLAPEEISYSSFEYFAPESGHTLLSIALIANNEAALDFLSADKDLVQKTLDNIKNSKLKLKQSQINKLCLVLGRKTHICQFPEDLVEKIRQTMSPDTTSPKKQSSTSQTQGHPDSSLMQSLSDDEQDYELDSKGGGGGAAALAAGSGGGGAAAASESKPKSNKTGFAGFFSTFSLGSLGSKSKPKPKTPETQEQSGTKLSVFELTPQQQEKRDDAQLDRLGYNYDDL